MNHNNNSERKGPLGPDAGTLHTTDPQEHMHGPVSSPMNDIADAAEKPKNAEPDYRDERERDGVKDEDR